MGQFGLRARQFAEYVVFCTFVGLVRCLSPGQCTLIARGMAWFFHRVLPRKWTRYEVARQNLKQALAVDGVPCSDPECDRLIGGMWLHLFRLVGEMIHLHRQLRLERTLELIEFHQKDVGLRALCSGRPVIMVGGHFGNWEMGISIFGRFGFPMGVVARDLDNPWLHAWFENFRQCTGHHTISKKGGFEAMTEELSRKGCLALLADQDAGGSGVFVDFFGKPASTHKSIALMALEHDALIVVGYATRRQEVLADGWPRYEVGCEAVFDPRDFAGVDAVRELTAAYTHSLEQVIRRAPEQYFWVHRRWKSVPRVRAKRRAA